MRTADKSRRRSGKHAGKRRQITTHAEVWALMDQARRAALEPSWSEWALTRLVIAAADELGLDPLECLSSAGLSEPETKARRSPSL